MCPCQASFLSYANNSNSSRSSPWRTLLFEGVSTQSQEVYEGTGRETQVCRRCEVCSNCSLSPSVSDYGEGGINTKTGNWRPLRFAIWCSPLVPDQLLGLSHGLVEQLPKRAAKPQFWYTGPNARTESESSRLTKRFQPLLQHQRALSAVPRAHSWNQQLTNTVDWLLNAIVGSEPILALQVNWVRVGFAGRIPFQALIWPSAYLNLTVIVGSAGWGSGLESNLSCSSTPLHLSTPPRPEGVWWRKRAAGSWTGLSKYQCYGGENAS